MDQLTTDPANCQEKLGLKNAGEHHLAPMGIRAVILEARNIAGEGGIGIETELEGALCVVLRSPLGSRVGLL